MHVCFIDLQKKHETVRREQLLEDVTRSGVQIKMLTCIRNIHDSMRARVGMDAGQYLEWFDVTQGLRQGRVLSPLLQLHNVVFAAVLHVYWYA